MFPQTICSLGTKIHVQTTSQGHCLEPPKQVPGLPCSVDHLQEGCHGHAWIYGDSNRDTKASHWLASGPDL